MRWISWFWAALAVGLAGPVRGQIEMSWSLAHSRTLLMEPVRATVRISNYSGHDLDLMPNGNARLVFEVEDQPTSLVPVTGQPLVRKPVMIAHNETREVDVNLLDAYRIIKGQSYMLTPVLIFDGMHFSGARLSLEVQPGLELLRRDYGLRSSGEGRSVFLRLIHRDGSDRLFFRIDNPANGFCLGVHELGRVIRFFVPRLEQDRDGVFHVLHQNGPDRFVHSRFDRDGRGQGVTLYTAEVGSLRMDRTEDGDIAVTGGTPYEEDPENPGMLLVPSLPPSTPYKMTVGELPPKGKPVEPEAGRGRKVLDPREDRHWKKVE